ncbi:hypothetical protein LZ32DRAFT_118539 [Colletotrichum eremochloae]|nr:hypothetical protein LZ32DRAFT_118539 [Colletotrichum eremochloae]
MTSLQQANMTPFIPSYTRVSRSLFARFDKQDVPGMQVSDVGRPATENTRQWLFLFLFVVVVSIKWCTYYNRQQSYLKLLTSESPRSLKFCFY